VWLPLSSFGQSYFGKFFLQGPLAPAAVQWLCGADMDEKAVGSVTYTPLCNANGGTEADLTVTRLGPQARPNTTQPHHTTPHRTDGKALRVPAPPCCRPQWYCIASANPNPNPVLRLTLIQRWPQRYYIASGGGTITKDAAWMARALDDRFGAAECAAGLELKDASGDMAVLSVQVRVRVRVADAAAAAAATVPPHAAVGSHSALPCIVTRAAAQARGRVVACAGSA
jgi:hypothetical protein